MQLDVNTVIFEFPVPTTNKPILRTQALDNMHEKYQQFNSEHLNV